MSQFSPSYLPKALDEEKPEGAVNEAQRQVAFADVLLANKSDLISEAEAEKLTGRVREINLSAPIYQTKYSEYAQFHSMYVVNF